MAAPRMARQLSTATQPVNRSEREPIPVRHCNQPVRSGVICSVPRSGDGQFNDVRNHLDGPGGRSMLDNLDERVVHRADLVGVVGAVDLLPQNGDVSGWSRPLDG